MDAAAITRLLSQRQHEIEEKLGLGSGMVVSHFSIEFDEGQFHVFSLDDERDKRISATLTVEEMASDEWFDLVESRLAMRPTTF